MHVKKLADEVGWMYKFKSKQIQLFEFGMPMGVTLSPNNRWVKKAELIPWDEIEIKYAELFKNRKGNVAKPLRLALGALIIQTSYNFSDEETAIQIMETPALQFFCGLREYKEEMPFDPSLMVYFRKRLTSEILGEVNELIIKKATEQHTAEHNNSSDDSDPPNSGTLIVDATCAPSNIKFPQDIELLNEAREKLEKVIDGLHDPKDGIKPRTYRKNARKDYLNIIRRKKKSSKEIRKATGRQLRYIRRDFDIIKQMNKPLNAKQEALTDTLKKLYEQQLFMYENRTHSVLNRIVSISQPYLRPIVRGKTGAPVEFGAKLDISVTDGYTRLEKISFEAYNEGEYLKNIIERYRLRTGFYPARVLVDKIYRNRENLMFCKENGIRLSGPSLGRPKKDVVVDKKIQYADNADRIEVERKFSLAKGKFGLGFIRCRLSETTKTAIALSVLALNLAKILCAFLRVMLFRWFDMPRFSISAFVQ